jgi:hypothetical protein
LLPDNIDHLFHTMIHLTVVIAMGSPKGGTVGGGSIITYKYNDSSFTWDLHGRIESSTAGEDAGYSMYLSDDGSKMAVGVPRAANTFGPSTTGKHAGKTAVYSMSGLGWQVLGQEVFGESQGDLDGESVAMSQDGSVVVIGGKGRSAVTTTGEVYLKSTGHCRVFLFEAGEWTFLHALVGSSPEEHLGAAVAVSSDGNTVACGGASGANVNSEKNGVVRLWNRVTLKESTIYPREAGNDMDPATFGMSLALSAHGECVTVGAPSWSGADGEVSSPGAIQIFS